MAVGGIDPDWIAVDWGTSACRAWAMAGTDVLAEVQSDKGMGTLDKSGFEPALLELVGDWITGPVRVVVCGMAGSRQGWIEAPYAAVPCTPAALSTARAPTVDPRLDVTIIGGVQQDRPADVMRGEETQIAGFLAENQGFDGVLCLPGTHSKWARVSAGEIVNFQTYMTGEMFALLSRQSVLRHSIGSGQDDATFVKAVSDTLSRPERLAAHLFSIRAETLLHGLSGDAAASRLSGLLIGAELAAAKPYWLGQDVALVGASALSRVYAKALETQGLSARIADATRMTLIGLAACHAQTEKAQ